MKKVTIDLSYDISVILEKEQVIDCSLAFNGDILILTLLNNPDRYEERGFAAFPKIKVDNVNHYRIHRISSNGDQCINIYNQKMNYHFIRGIDDDNFLLACARSYFYSKSKYDLNVFLIVMEMR